MVWNDDTYPLVFDWKFGQDVAERPIAEPTMVGLRQGREQGRLFHASKQFLYIEGRFMY